LEQIACDLRDSVKEGDLGMCCDEEEKTRIIEEVEIVLKWIKEQSKLPRGSDLKAHKERLKKVSSPSILKLQKKTLENMFKILNKARKPKLKE